jgi:hypothetical protein
MSNPSIDEIVASLELWMQRGFFAPETELRIAALISDWRLRGELLKAERLYIIELEVENAELVARRAEIARLRAENRMLGECKS